MSDDLEIRNLIARYAELLNLGQLDELGELFRYGRITAGGTSMVWAGSQEVVSMYRNAVHFNEKLPDTLLFTSNLQIQIEGDTAKCKAYYVAMHEMGGAVVPVVAGRYHDEFRRIDGAWWFHERCMFRDLVGDLSTHLRQSNAEGAAQ